jgi:hypothetical protein
MQQFIGIGFETFLLSKEIETDQVFSTGEQIAIISVLKLSLRMISFIVLGKTE